MSTSVGSGTVLELERLSPNPDGAECLAIAVGFSGAGLGLRLLAQVRSHRRDRCVAQPSSDHPLLLFSAVWGSPGCGGWRSPFKGTNVVGC
jgi:hypothetical protein